MIFFLTPTRNMDKGMMINDMDIISNEDKFILGGKRITIYNNDLMRKNLR